MRPLSSPRLAVLAAALLPLLCTVMATWLAERWHRLAALALTVLCALSAPIARCRPWKPTMPWALALSCLWLLSACGTAHSPAVMCPPVPADLLEPPAPPVLLGPGSPFGTPGATRPSTPSSAPATGRGIRA